MTFEGVGDFIRARKSAQTHSDGFSEIEQFVKDRQISDSTEQSWLVQDVSKFLEDYKEDPRKPGFHVSEIAHKFCPVKWALKTITQKQKQISYRLRYRFDIGTLMHSLVQKYFSEMGILKGFWKCRNGHVTTEISLMPKNGCPTCGEKINYKEIELEHEVRPGYNIVGSTDGVIYKGGEDLGLEIKSLEPNVLASMNKPYPYPIFQLNIYMHLLRMKLFPNMKRGIVLLVSPMEKDAILIPMKSFYIDYTDSFWTEAYDKVSQAVDLVEAFKAGKLTGQALIAKRVCPSRAQAGKAECEHVTTCFDTASIVTLLTKCYAAQKGSV